MAGWKPLHTGHFIHHRSESVVGNNIFLILSEAPFQCSRLVLKRCMISLFSLFSKVLSCKIFRILSWISGFVVGSHWFFVTGVKNQHLTYLSRKKIINQIQPLLQKLKKKQFRRKGLTQLQKCEITVKKVPGAFYQLYNLCGEIDIERHTFIAFWYVSPSLNE